MIVGLLSAVATREADWQSALIRFVGAVMSGAGLYPVVRGSGPRGTRQSHPEPRPSFRWIGEL